MASQLPSGGIGIEPISAGISAATQIVSTIASISDMNKRRDVEQALGRLSLAEQNAIARELNRAKTQSERLSILTNAVASIRSAEATQKLKNLGMEEADRRKKEMTMIYLIVGLGIAAVLTVVLIKKV